MVKEYGGWAGRILQVDLTTGELVYHHTLDYALDYIGGRGIGAALAWELLQPGIGPFDPQNPLMFLNGPLAGTGAPAAGRTTICSLTPQGYPYSWFSRASMGGDLSHHLKYAGYDGLVFMGKAAVPTLFVLSDDQAKLVEAQDLWGMDIIETQHVLRERWGSEMQVATIGPAGENLSRIASIGTNAGSAAGQGGFGAVMGAKNLKALVVHGTGRPIIADKEGFRSFARRVAQEYVQDNRNRPQRGRGKSAYNAKRNRCSAGCLMGCGTHYEDVPGTVFPDTEYSGIVQCTAGRFSGAEDHYWDLGFEAGFELNMLANRWGINHWDLMKGLFPWIGMCHRAGLMEEIGGRPIERDEPEFWYDILKAIATHKGPIAEIVADGGRRAIARTGCLPDEARQLYTAWGYANHWDGRGPRGNRITYPFWLASALLWMIDTRDPMGSTHGYVQDMTRISPFGEDVLNWEQLQGLGERIYGTSAAMDPLSDYEGKAEPALWHARRSLIKDSLPLCDRTFPRLFTSLTDDGLPRTNGIEGPDFEAHFCKLATGHEIEPEELEQAAERALTLERLEQLRDFGRTRETDDDILDFFCDTLEEYTNPLLEERKRAEHGPLTELATSFYALRGWDTDTGIPSKEQLKRLNLGHTIKVLEQYGTKIT